MRGSLLAAPAVAEEASRGRKSLTQRFLSELMVTSLESTGMWVVGSDDAAVVGGVIGLQTEPSTTLI